MKPQNCGTVPVPVVGPVRSVLRTYGYLKSDVRASHQGTFIRGICHRWKDGTMDMRELPVVLKIRVQLSLVCTGAGTCGQVFAGLGRSRTVFTLDYWHQRVWTPRGVPPSPAPPWRTCTRCRDTRGAWVSGQVSSQLSAPSAHLNDVTLECRVLLQY